MRPSTIRWEASATSSQMPLSSSSARRRSFSGTYLLIRRYHAGSSISLTGPWQRQQVPPGSTCMEASVVWQLSHQSTFPVPR